MALLRWSSGVYLVSLGSFSALVGRLCSTSVVSSSLRSCQWWEGAIPHMVLLTPISKASSPSLGGPTVAGILSYLLACSTYHALMAHFCLVALCALLTWSLVLGLLILMVLWPRFSLIPLLAQESLIFILSLLHIDGSVIHLLVRVVWVYRHCDIQLMVQPGLESVHLESFIRGIAP